MDIVSVAVAVALFIFSDSIIAPFRYIENGEFELSYNVSGIIKEHKKLYMPIHTKKLIVSVALFILGALPIVIVSQTSASETIEAAMVVVFLTAVAIGVFNIIIGELEKGCYDKLLFEGYFEKQKAKQNKKDDPKKEAYWAIVATIYFLWSFLSYDWHITWIVWPVAGLLFIVVSALWLNDN